MNTAAALPSRGMPTARLRALWVVRDDLTAHPGGDTTQILKTADAIRRLGVTVEMADCRRCEPSGFDVVHLFHLDRLWEHRRPARLARAAGVPIALSTIWWPADEFDRGGRTGCQGWLARTFGSSAYRTLRLVQRSAMEALRGGPLFSGDAWAIRFSRSARRLVEQAAVLLPNSLAEQHAIEATLGVQRPTVVVPNAVDAEMFAPSAAAGGEVRGGVLCIGRIEPRKNQLALIEALGPTDTPLTLVGQAGRYSRRYAERCRAAAGPNVKFLPQVPPVELGALYRAARVHACPSWYETPGLASLEAGLCGCRLVVTPGGCTREYFGDEAHYCAPNDPASIRAAIEAALAAPPSGALARRVAAEFTWQRAAERTLEGYRIAVAQHRPGEFAAWDTGR
jgi:glycosyltransferase involved in cell wall biosynthesis